MPKRKSTKEERSKKRHSRTQARQKSSRVAKQARRVLASFTRVPRAKALLGSLLTKKKPKTKRGFRIVLELAGTGTKLGVIEVPSVNVGVKTIQQRCIAALKRNPNYHYKGRIFLRRGHAGSNLKSVKDWPKDEVIVVQHFIPLNSKEKQLVAKERKYMHDLRDDVRTEKEWKEWVQRRMQYAMSFEQYLTLKRHGVYYLAALEAGIKVLAHSSAQIQALRRDTGINPETLETFLARFQKYKRLYLIATSQDLIHVDV